MTPLSWSTGLTGLVESLMGTPSLWPEALGITMSHGMTWFAWSKKSPKLLESLFSECLWYIKIKEGVLLLSALWTLTFVFFFILDGSTNISHIMQLGWALRLYWLLTVLTIDYLQVPDTQSWEKHQQSGGRAPAASRYPSWPRMFPASIIRGEK